MSNSKKFFRQIHQEAHLYLSEGKFEAAIDVLSQGIKKHPNRASFYCGLGWVFSQQNNLQPAIKSYQKSISLDPKSARTYDCLANALQKIDRPIQSLGAYLHGIYLGKNSFFTLKQVGILFEKIVCENLQDSIGSCCQLIEQEICSSLLRSQLSTSQQADFYTTTADLLSEIKYYTGAVVLYRLALNIDFEDIEILQKYQTSLKNRAEEKAKKERYIARLQNEPDSIDLQMQLGNLLAKLGYFEEAHICYLQIAKLRGWNQAIENQYQFNQDYFTHNISHLFEYLQKFKTIPNLNFLEIGSFEGMSTCWLLDNILTHPSARLTCIDPQFQPVFDRNVEKTGSAEKVIALEGTSDRILKTLEPDRYDVIYIDGCHLSVVVFQDALLSWPLMKMGSTIVFDDYRWTDPDFPSEDPKIGIDAFVDLFADCLEILHQDYQLIVRKKSNLEARKLKEIYDRFDRDFKNSNQLLKVISASTLVTSDRTE